MKRITLFVAMLGLAGALAAPPASHAFDTEAHYDISGDALHAEGFVPLAVQTAQVNNWFQDLYVNSGDIPQSGHAVWWKVLFATRWWLGEVEHWSQSVIDAATASHFDSHDAGGATETRRASRASSTGSCARPSASAGRRDRRIRSTA